jgi:hypothetical protein
MFCHETTRFTESFSRSTGSNSSWCIYIYIYIIFRILVNKGYHSVAIQIKILMDIPEQIWSAVERRNYILGA